ncbi:aldolase/citrate lyase family protein [Enterovirga aerilata]|uniref:4-hydroxy-2-oxovalerate aldolase n=1 Tax=Enterovirga aerilata TaxID=2730920 RepID=A0A849I9Q7_9HYPH|nr:4-hydroxy-2-oxovalerate aldolase [Enterovirga sp. DB1703]
MRHRRGLAELRRLGRPAIGTWSQIASPEAVDLVAGAGFDFTVVDCEHGAFGLETAENLIRACDANAIVPMIRAPSHDPGWISRALDAGACAVIVPNARTAEEVRAAVSGTRFGARGRRGACPCVAAADQYTRDWPSFEAEQNERDQIIVLVETPEAVACLEEICAVDGVAAVALGPFDLSVTYGRGGDFRNPELVAALERTIAVAQAAGVAIMAPMLGMDPAHVRIQAASYAARGVEFLTVGTDKMLFAEGLRTYATALQGERKAAVSAAA